MKVNMILAIEGSDWKRTWRNSGLTGIQTLAFAMTEHNALFISYISIHVISTNQEYYILTMACSPVGFFISMDRALCLVVTKVMVWFLVNPENFQVIFLFLPLSRGIIFSRSIQIVFKNMQFGFFSAFLDYILQLNSLDLLYSNKGQTK